MAAVYYVIEEKPLESPSWTAAAIADRSDPRGHLATYHRIHPEKSHRLVQITVTESRLLVARKIGKR